MGLLVAGPASAAGRDLRLIDASRRDDAPAVKTLLASGADVNARSGDTSTALHWAAQNDDLTVADALIRKGAKVNAVTDLGITPLWIAASNSSTAMIDRLLQAHADPNIAPQTNGTPLMIAARLGNADAVKALLDHGADPNAKEASHGQTALMWAVSGRHPDVVRLLLAAHADVGARTKSWTQRVLMCCQYYESESDGDDTVVKGGYTALLFAAQDGDVATVKMLLAAGADIKDAAPDGSSALLIAAHAEQDDVAAALLDAGADPNAAGTGYSALHIAAISGNLALAKALLDHGADIDARQLKGSPTKRTQNGHSLDHTLVGATPYFLAVRAGQMEMMKLLARRGADVTIPLQDGRPALMVLAGEVTLEGPVISEARAVQVVKLATQLGTPVDQADANGDTALHEAATLRRDLVVQALADNGAALEIRNHEGDTPLAVALKPTPPLKGSGLTDEDVYRLHHTGTAELLRKLGAKS
jgi:ankyrin repeat protein